MKRLALSTILFASVSSALAQIPSIVTAEHKVRVSSNVPSIAGQNVELYARERFPEGMLAVPPADRVVLFVHGAGTPAEVAFDVPRGDYSWMAYLAKGGFVVYSMDTSGYGRSVRPAPMNDPCNLSQEQQKQFVPALIPAPCPASYPGQLTTIASDWHDIDAVVNHIRSSRKVDKVSLVAWSLGGPRAGGYAAQHPDKVHRLVLLAPAYNRDARAEPPQLPNPGTVFNTQSRTEFDANWDRQVGCPNQVDPAVREVVWKEMLASDPVGATWGSGVRRAPSTTTWGWNAEMIGKTRTPTLMVAGALDRQVPPERVKAAFADLGAPEKVLLDLGCASHNAMWETNHLLLFSASLEWLTKGTVDGRREGVVSMGYAKPEGHASAQVSGPLAPSLTRAQIEASQALAQKYDRSAAMEQSRQATFKDRPVGAIVQKSFDAFANFLIIAAQMMPESGYIVRPTPDVRTFGEQINHATGANYSFCNQAGVPPGFERRNAPSLQSVTTKSAIVKALEDSVAYCSSLIAATSEAWLLESAPNLGGAGSGRITGARAYAFIYAGIHGAEDYGTITTYLRMQGLVPPSTALVTK